MRTFVSAEDLVGHLRGLGDVGSDEAIAFSELDHGLQTAAILARAHPDDIQLRVAGLVHDLAHPWDGPGQPEHHRLGATAVRDLLGDRVAFLIEAHVDAKRYLVATDADYREELSPGSIVTLAAQGGPLTADEVESVERHSQWAAAVELRRADDRAKIAGAEVPDLGHWIDDIGLVANRAARSRGAD